METYLNNVDVDKVNKIMNDTEANVQYFNDTCAAVVKKYSEGLDNLMSDLYVECIRDSDVTISTLERYYLELTNMVYFMQEKVEQLGVYADMSSSASKEVYSKSVINQSALKDAAGKSKVTVAEVQAQANISAQYESVVATIYDSAYRTVKNKVASAQDMMNTLRKLITSRQTEMQLNLYGSKETINEN